MRNDFFFDRVHGYHYAAHGEPAYSLLIAHGIGGHGGTYDVFCEPLAERGVNVVSMDLPGHGLARNTRGNWRFTEWLEDLHLAATAMRARWGKPVFVLGSSQGSAAAFHSLAFSDAIAGAITMCIILSEVVPDESDDLYHRFREFRSQEGRSTARREGDRKRIDLATTLDWNKNYAANESNVLEKKMKDLLRPWTYGYASLASYYTYEPLIPASENSKPVLITGGENDQLVSAAYVRKCFEAVGGPKTLEIVPGGGHQLLLYHTEQYVPLVDGWVRRQLQPKPQAVAA